jgi:orotate phosphoribosyltransferase
LGEAYLIETSGDEARFYEWKSGIRAPVYCNCRVLFGHPGPRATVVRSLASAILQGYPTVNHIVGLAEAGIVWASAVASELGQPVAYVSKAEKKHGIKGLVVGAMPSDPAMVQAVIVDDLVASGDTLVRALETLKVEKGIVPVGIQSIVHWDFQRTHQRFESFGIPMSTLVSYPEILRAALEEELLGRDAVEELCEFYQEPSQYVWTARALATLRRTPMARAM